MTHDLTNRYGKTALVTGASAGIGKAFARGLAAEGCDLVLVARREQALQALCGELSASHGITAHAVAQDLSVADAAPQLGAKVAALGVEVDILVNNAGFGTYGPFETLDVQRELAMVNLNCALPVALTHQYLPGMLERGRGAVIVLASVAGTMPVPYMSTYSATKAFDRYFAESLYGELRGRGIDVLAVLPGDTSTEFKQTSNLDKTFPVPVRTADDVVATALGALGHKPSVTDGVFNKASAVSAGWLPRKVLVAAGKRLFAP